MFVSNSPTDVISFSVSKVFNCTSHSSLVRGLIICWLNYYSSFLTCPPTYILAYSVSSQKSNSLQVKSYHPSIHLTPVTTLFTNNKGPNLSAVLHLLKVCSCISFTSPCHPTFPLLEPHWILLFHEHFALALTTAWNALTQKCMSNSLIFHKFCLNASEVYTALYIKC